MLIAGLSDDFFEDLMTIGTLGVVADVEEAGVHGDVFHVEDHLVETAMMFYQAGGEEVASGGTGSDVGGFAFTVLAI